MYFLKGQFVFVVVAVKNYSANISVFLDKAMGFVLAVDLEEQVGSLTSSGSPRKVHSFMSISRRLTLFDRRFHFNEHFKHIIIKACKSPTEMSVMAVAHW